MDLFNLAARITLDTSEYDEGIKEASEKTSTLGDKLKSGLKTAGRIAAGAVVAGAAAVSAVVKNAVQEYADYEQLIGGVETLFKDSADSVKEYADNAYKTAGLSANQYMETVTSFSASLLQSLGGDTEKAAKIGDMAITDMADNANKMGSSMESIQMAYQGFAKQNYTMLDNLKLGYGGTKTEMERLLADATALSGIEYDINSLADVYEAIHVIQTELDITGTTAKEASTTISGSIASMKSAWQNLLVGVADENADFGKLLDNFVSSVTTAAGNILPRITQALQGVGGLVEGLAPVIADAIPVLMTDVLPSILRAAGSLVSSIGKALLDNLPTIVNVGLELVLMLANGISQSLPTLIPAIVGVVLQIVDTLTQPDTLVALVDAAIALVLGLADGILDALPLLIDKIPVIVENLVTALVEATPLLVKGAIQLVIGIVSHLPEIIAGLIEAIPSIIEAIVGGFKPLLGGLLGVFGETWEAIKKKSVETWENIKSFISNTLDTLKQKTKEKLDGLKKVYEENGGGIQGVVAAGWTAIKDAYETGYNFLDKLTGGRLTKIKDTIVNVFKNLKESALNWGKDLLQNFIDGITSKIKALTDKVSSVAKTVKNFLGFSEPEEGPLSDFHTYAPDMMKLFAQGITQNAGIVSNALDKALRFDSLNGLDAAAQKPVQPAIGYGGIVINVQNMSVRKDEDIQNIARELYALSQRKSRGRGVLA